MKTQKPNYTQIPNIILDSMASFTHTEFKVAMLVCRHTFGWQRERKKMSFSYVQEGCGLSREAVNNAFITLLEKGILERTASGNSYEYQLNIVEIGSPNEPLSESVRQTDQFAKQTDNGSVNEPIASKSVRQTDTKKERGVNKRKETPPIEIPQTLKTPEFQKAWTTWLEHLRQKNTKPTELAKTLQLKKLAGIGNLRAVAAIYHSITQSWQGIYEPKNDESIKTNRQTHIPDANYDSGFKVIP